MSRRSNNAVSATSIKRKPAVLCQRPDASVSGHSILRWTTMDAGFVEAASISFIGAYPIQLRPANLAIRRGREDRADWRRVTEYGSLHAELTPSGVGRASRSGPVFQSRGLGSFAVRF